MLLYIYLSEKKLLANITINKKMQHRVYYVYHEEYQANKWQLCLVLIHRL